MEWKLHIPAKPGVYLRKTARQGFYQQHRLIPAEHGLRKGLWLSWGTRLAHIDTLPAFYWFGPIPEAPEAGLSPHEA